MSWRAVPGNVQAGTGTSCDSARGVAAGVCGEAGASVSAGAVVAGMSSEIVPALLPIGIEAYMSLLLTGCGSMAAKYTTW